MGQGNSTAGRKRVLVIEDELMIRMLLQDMLDDLGHTLAGEAGRIDEAVTLARQAEFDIAILDVNLNGEPISPVVEVLVAVIVHVTVLLDVSTEPVFCKLQVAFPV